MLSHFLALKKLMLPHVFFDFARLASAPTLLAVAQPTFRMTLRSKNTMAHSRAFSLA